jgi:hypothetical protein
VGRAAEGIIDADLAVVVEDVRTFQVQAGAKPIRCLSGAMAITTRS